MEDDEDKNDKVIDLADYQPSYYFEAICLHCFHRAIVVVPVDTQLKILECGQKSCGKIGGIISTGQMLDPPDEDDGKSPLPN